MELIVTLADGVWGDGVVLSCLLHVSKSPSCGRNAFFLLTVVKKVARGEGEKQKNIVQVLGSSRFNLFVCLPLQSGKHPTRRAYFLNGWRLPTN